MTSLNTEVLSSGPARYSSLCWLLKGGSLDSSSAMAVPQRAHGDLQHKERFLAAWFGEMLVTWWWRWVRMCTLVSGSWQGRGPSVELPCQPNLRQPQAVLTFWHNSLAFNLLRSVTLGIFFFSLLDWSFSTIQSGSQSFYSSLSVVSCNSMSWQRSHVDKSLDIHSLEHISDEY